MWMSWMLVWRTFHEFPWGVLRNERLVFCQGKICFSDSFNLIKLSICITCEQSLAHQKLEDTRYILCVRYRYRYCLFPAQPYWSFTDRFGVAIGALGRFFFEFNSGKALPPSVQYPFPPYHIHFIRKLAFFLFFISNFPFSCLSMISSYFRSIYVCLLKA